MLINESDLDVPDIDKLGVVAPTFWSGRPIKMDDQLDTVFVFLKKYEMHFPSEAFMEIYFYGAKYLLANAFVDNIKKGADYPGYFLEFYAVSITAVGVGKVIRLSQSMSVTFSDEPESRDIVFMDSLSKSDLPSLNGLPEWKWSEACWPKVNDELMTFMFQFDLVDTPINRKYLTWNERIFFFCKSTNDRLRVKALTQQIKFQTARGHYIGETRRLSAKKRGATKKATTKKGLEKGLE